MKKIPLMLCAIALCFMPFTLKSDAQSQQTPKKGEPPTNVTPPQELLDRIGKPIPNAPPPPPDDKAAREAQGNRNANWDLSTKIAQDKELPSEWDSLTDEEVQREIFKLTLRDQKPPRGWDPAKKFIKAEGDELPPVEASNRWQVVFTAKVKLKDFDAEIKRILNQYGGKEMVRIDSPFDRGFWIETDARRAEAISRDRAVRVVEQTKQLKGNRSSAEKTKHISPAELKKMVRAAYTTRAKIADRFTDQYNLDRIDNRNQTIDGLYRNRNEGANVDIYVIDDGVAANASEFGLRRVDYLNFFGNYCNHGTAIGDFAAGTVFGVAPQATIVSIGISTCAGTFATSDVINNYLIQVRARISLLSPRPAVLVFASGLLDAPFSLNTRLTDIIDGEDTPVVVAAGQTARVPSGTMLTDHTRFWPARHPKVYNVGYIDNFDRMVGSVCEAQDEQIQYTGIDIFAWAGPKYTQNAPCNYQASAPGILAINTIGGGQYVSGSSFAAPHVAGIYAQVLASNQTFKAHQNWVYRVVNDFAGVGVQYLAQGAANRTAYDLYYGLTVAANAASYAEGTAPDSLVAAFAQFGSKPGSVFLEHPNG